MIDLQKFAPKAVKVYNVLAFLSILPLFVVMNTEVLVRANKIHNLLILIPSLIAIFYSIKGWKRGHRPSMYYCISSLPVLLLSITSTAISANPSLSEIIPNPSALLMLLGIVQVVILSLALADKINQLREEQVAEHEKHSGEIKVLNESLELRVEEQTRDIKSMLASTKVGLFSVSNDFSIHKDYSAHLEKILEESELSGKLFEEILLNKLIINADDKDKITTAIEYTLGEDEIFFEVNSDCFPKEVRANIGESEKILDLDWTPLLDKDNSIERILISVKDMTETVALRMAAEESKKELRYLGELIKVGPAMFNDFRRNADETIAKSREILAQGKETNTLSQKQIKELFILLHTIKGAARFYKFIDFTNEVHIAEEIVAHKDIIGSDQYQELVAQIQNVEDIYQLYLNALEPLKRITEQLGSMDSNLDDFDINKIIEGMQAVADDLAKELGKNGCTLKSEIPNGTILSADFHDALSKTLIHLIRNSIDHGLEAPQERIEKGKPERGELRLYIDSNGYLCFEDDGKGLNIDAIREKAKSKGLSVSSKVNEVIQLIFDSGFSTKEEATDVSGRGVGMDAVRTFVRNVGSDIEIKPKNPNGENNSSGFMEVYFAIKLPNSALAKAS